MYMFLKQNVLDKKQTYKKSAVQFNIDYTSPVSVSQLKYCKVL